MEIKENSMKRYTFRLFMMVFFFITVAVALAPDSVTTKITVGTPSAENFPYTLLLPMLIGMVAHWLRGFDRGTISLNLWDYILDSVGKTISAVVGAVSQLIGLYALSPEKFSGSFVTWWFVFLIGFASDSALNGSSTVNVKK
jgi:hypothetical protein